jgi:murein DD-endopeptidase MepM/ murein hydrolase activator NlpD
LTYAKKSESQNQNTYTYYTVKKGDTLYSVAKNHSISVDSVANLNNLSNKANLNTGMKLKIPSQNIQSAQKNQNTQNTNVKKSEVQANNQKQNTYVYYTVKKGDTLYSVAKNHSLNVNTIADFNNFNNKTDLNIGMKIKIPNLEKSNFKPAEKNEKNYNNLPKFIWPAKNILTFKNDGTSGVKSIGLVIFSKPGTEIISSARGTVKKIGEMHGYGQYVVISHENRYITVYSNLVGIRVKEGEEVIPGKVIALSDNETGKIHFQIDHAGRPADPLKYLPKKS